jgi:hypothetical protein
MHPSLLSTDLVPKMLSIRIHIGCAFTTRYDHFPSRLSVLTATPDCVHLMFLISKQFDPIVSMY